MPRKLFYTIILCAVLVGGGIGCKGSSQEELATVQAESLEYWTVFNDVNMIRQFANEYRQLRPHVSINVRQVRYNEFDNLLINALADDVPPDIVSLHTRWVPRYRGRLSTVPASVQVSRLAQTGSSISKETVVQTTENALPTAGDIKDLYVNTVTKDVVSGFDIYGLPLSVDSLALYYNKDILDRAAIPLPPTTWAELLEQVEKTTVFDPAGNIVQAGIALGTGSNVENAPDILAALLLQNGVPVIKDGVVGFASGIDRQVDGHPTRETLRFYTDFARPTKAAYSWNADLGDARSEFAGGRVAFYLGFAFDADEIKQINPQINMQVVPLPQLNPNNPQNVANYWVESVMAKSEYQNTAWDFIRYMSTEENIKRYSDATGRLSPLRQHLPILADDEFFAPFITTLLTAENWYVGFAIDTATEAMRNMIDQFLTPYGDLDPVKRDRTIIENAAAVIQQTL